MIAIGIGANSRANVRDFATAVDAARSEVDAELVATYEAANFARHVQDAARSAGLAFRPVALEAMRERSKDCRTRSEHALALFGVASIAEAAALAAAGPGSHLVMPRRTSGNITIAAARSANDTEQRT